MDDLIKRLREPPYRRAAETEDEAKIRRQNDREEAATALTEAQAEIARLREALRSIGANTCCDGCQEAALVARAALAQGKTEGA